MKNLITIDNSSLGSLVGEFAILIILFAIIIWFFTVLVIQTRNMKRSGFTQRIKLSLKNALIIAMVIFAFYFSVFVAINGKDSFYWNSFPFDSSNTYYVLLPQIFLFLGIITSFLFVSVGLKKELKRK